MDDDLVDAARALAEAMLRDAIPRRWQHVQGVAGRAAELSAGLRSSDRSVLLASAWLHDVGNSPAVAMTGFHPLDGARFLSAEDFHPEVVQLVAFHSGAEVEADERHLLTELARFSEPPADLLRRLTAADMSTSPDGLPIDPRFRIREILVRYEPEHPVHRAVTRSGPDLIAVAEAVAAEVG